MTSPLALTLDPSLDLRFERILGVPPELVWRAWTVPQILMRWFTPVPWTTTGCDIDLRPGGRFRTVMRSPEGQEFENAGCYLEVVPNERLTWTSALGPGFRPAGTAGADALGIVFTAAISLERHPNGTRYTAQAMHGDAGGAIDTSRWDSRAAGERRSSSSWRSQKHSERGGGI